MTKYRIGRWWLAKWRTFRYEIWGFPPVPEAETPYRITERASPIRCANCERWAVHGDPADSVYGTTTRWFVRHGINEKAPDCVCSKACYDQLTGGTSI